MEAEHPARIAAPASSSAAAKRRPASRWHKLRCERDVAIGTKPVAPLHRGRVPPTAFPPLPKQRNDCQFKQLQGALNPQYDQGRVAPRRRSWRLCGRPASVENAARMRLAAVTSKVNL